MSNTATRLITLIMLLQRKPNQTAGQLAKELGVSMRTAQRYIAMLDEMGIPIYAERGPYGGYALVRGYKMPPLVFTPQEAVAIYLGTRLIEEVWGRLYQEAARGALAKLDNVLPDEQRSEVAWARQALRAVWMQWGDPNLSAPYLAKLRDALRERRRVSMTYRGQSQPEPLQRDFDPYTLVHGWGWQYCIGYCHLRQAIRSFRLDRILDLTVLEQTFDEPADFDVKTYIATEPFLQCRLRVRLYYAPEAALIALDNRASWDTFEEQADGSIIVSFNTPGLEAAVRMVLSFAYPGIVLEPEELRDRVQERARAIAAQYDSTTQTNHVRQ